MRPRSLWIRLLVPLVLAWIIAPPAPADAQTPKRGGTLRVSYGNEIANLDFHTAPGYEMMWVAMNVGCGLVNITPDGKFVGDAAESWQMSSDGLLYTFKLRKNVLFHDGTPVDAAAVKFSIDRLHGPGHQVGHAHLLRARPQRGGARPADRADPAQAPLRLLPPHARRPTARASSSTRRPPPRSSRWRTASRASRSAIVGCGPFKFVEWVKGSHLVMERFDKYFVPGLPYLDRVIIRVIKDPVTEMAAFKAGEVDFIASFSPEHVDTMKAQIPNAAGHDGQGNDADAGGDEGDRPQGRQAHVEGAGARIRSSATSGCARRSAATASTARRS